MAKAGFWTVTDTEARKRWEQTVLYTQVFGQRGGEGRQAHRVREANFG